MITLTSTSNDTAAIEAVFAAKGITPVAPEPEVAKASEGEDKKTPVDTPVEGQEHSESVPVDKKAAEDKPQEKEAKSKVEGEVEVEKPKAKGGFQAKIDKLTATRDRLMEDLDTERGSKTKVQAQLDEANAELAKLKPTPKEEVKQAGPERPKRPSREQFEYDDSAYEAAMAKYDVDLDTYHEEVRRIDREAIKSEIAEDSKKKEISKAEQARLDEFGKRMEEGRKGVPDLDELLAEIPDGHKGLLDISPVAENYILRKAKNPAGILHYLANDYVNGDEAESKRLLALDDYDLVIALKSIEDGLTKAPTAKSEPETEKAKEPPAKSQPKPKQAVPDDPIETVGGRHQPVSGTLDEQIAAAAKAGDGKLYMDLRKQQRLAKQPAKVA